MLKKIVIFSDGGSRNNPGQAAGGAVVMCDDEKKIIATGRYYGIATNNQAEYRGLIDALNVVDGLYKDDVSKDIVLEIFLDSELIVKQLNGQYQVKSDDLRPLYEQIQQKLSKYGQVIIAHVLRSNNKLADKLVNETLDRWGK